MRLWWLAPVSLLVVAAASAPLAAPGGQGGKEAVKVTLADVGLESGSLDRTSDPCVDFYQFACGGWIAQNQIPADRNELDRFYELEDRTNANLKALLEDASKGGDAATKKLGDFYASCMDASAIDARGLAPIKPALDRIAKVKDGRSWNAAVTELHRLGVPVVWEASALSDFKDSTTNVIYLDPAGLGLPDRDYYTKPDHAAQLAAYKAQVTDMLGLLGVTGAKGDDVAAIETDLAALNKSRVERRDPNGEYNPTDAAALAKQVKSLDWKAYWKALDTVPSKKLVETNPKYFAAIDKLRAKYKPKQWAAYFAYHLAETYSIALPANIDDKAFELQKLLEGVEAKPERSRRCIEATEQVLGEALGQLYATRYFPGGSKQTSTKMVDALVTAMTEELTKLDWMSDATKQIALGKLGKIVRMVGYPDKWKTYDFDVKREDFAGNVMRGTTFETHRELAKAGKPVDRGEWRMNVYAINAYYSSLANNTAITAGILQTPFFGQDRSVAANLGGIGFVIGHELTHGFDDQGAKFDADGNLKNWWSKEDQEKFEQRGSCVADQYSSFEVLPKQFINGRLTLGENIADLGGVKLAFRAYRALRKDAPKTYVADGFTEDQQFFIATAQVWCDKNRPANTARLLVVDPHSPSKFRVYGALRNMPEFAEAFSCSAGTPMRPAKTCSVW